MGSDMCRIFVADENSLHFIRQLNSLILPTITVLLEDGSQWARRLSGNCRLTRKKNHHSRPTPTIIPLKRKPKTYLLISLNYFTECVISFLKCCISDCNADSFELELQKML